MRTGRPGSARHDRSPARRPGRREHRTHHRAVLALLAISAAIVATAAPAVAKAKPSAADRVMLRAGVVTAADVPAGWTATNQVDTSADQFQGITVCRAVHRAVFTARATVPYKLSQAFSPPGPDNGLTSVDDTVLAFRTDARADAFVAVFERPSAGTCLQAVLARGLRGEGHATVAPLAVAPAGDAAVGYEARITSTSAGLTGSQVGDIVVLRVGRVVAYFSSLNAAAAPLPQGPAIVAAVAGRLRAVGA